MKQGVSFPHVTLDGLAFELQSIGGISQIYRECLPRVCEMGALMNIYTASQPQQPIPAHPRLRHTDLGSYGRLARLGGKSIIVSAFFRRTLFASHLRGRSGSIWQSTYFTLPPRRWSGPNVVLVADMTYELFPHLLRSAGAALFRKQKRRCVNAADIIICISETTKRDVLSMFDLSTTEVHAVHLAASQAYGATPVAEQDRLRTPFFLYVGGRTSYKNFGVVLDALEIWSRRTEASLLVAGPPFSSTEMRTITDRGLMQTVRHVGQPTNSELAQLYGTAAAFIYPSLYEGFGIPLVEAMSCGCPVIASDIPSSREIAQDCATYFDPSDADTLVAALDDALGTPSGTDVKCGLRRAKDFSWDRTSQRLYQIYENAQQGG